MSKNENKNKDETLTITPEAAALISLLKLLHKKEIISQDDLKWLAMDFDALSKIICDREDTGGVDRLLIVMMTIADPENIGRIALEAFGDRKLSGKDG